MDQELMEEQVTWYEVPYPASAYTFPRESLIHDVRFDNEYIQVELTDGRVLSVPLWWVPSVHNAPMVEREKFEISRDRRMVTWDPDHCEINDEMRIDDYLVAKA
ncbi:MAG TPA: DUF2442 domain-containing protein [Anaerolineae bacterium]|nr:DUF2442 domain-containing protein [Anaerolineae bacterium]